MSTSCRPATTPAPPARTSRPGSPMRRRAATARRGRRWCGTTPCRPCTAASAITRARSAAIARSSTARSASTRSSAFSATWRRGRLAAADRRRRRSGKRVLVVGAGPSGLSAAYHLARLGHEVEIHEAGPLPGGMMHFGIPAYRLPRAELMKEIRRIEEMGVRIVAQSQGRRCRRRKDAGEFDAVFIAIGAHVSQACRHSGARRRQGARRGDAAARRRDRRGAALGRRVVVYGGGNTAMDAARTARRLGAEEALIVYRRDRAHMPAHAFEADEAIDGGRQDQVADEHQRDRRRRSHRRGDGARRQRPAAADRTVRDARGRRGRAGARPGDRQRLPEASARRSNSSPTAR